MITIISTKKSWIEGTAIQQLEQVHTLNGVQSVVGLPDLHAGPVGIAMASKNVFYPHLVGNDIGCGMAFWQTNTPTHKVKLDRWVKKLDGLEHAYEGDTTELFQKHGLQEQKFASAMGTIGLGNHFAELQKVHQIHNSTLFTKFGLDKKKITLLVHSGSRGLGKAIMDEHIEQNGAIGLQEDSLAAKEYLQKHDYALQWANANRELIAHRFCNSLGLKGKEILNLSHNSVVKQSFGSESLWLHRKGANPNNQGLAVIAGSRGSLSYLVLPKGDFAQSNFSIAHGAGRKWKRNEMEGRLKNKQNAESLKQTSLGSRVICENKKLLYEEAPEAYKDIHQVIYDLESHGLIEVVASYAPIITYKTRSK